MTMVKEVKAKYWDLQRTWRDARFRLLAIPAGPLGQRLRARLLVSMFGACGENPVIQESLRVMNPEKLLLGDHCSIASGVFITAGGGVRLGNYVGLGPDVKIWSVNHIYDDPDRPWIQQGYEYKEVVIGDDAWIGANSIIKPGVTIGKGAIISAGTVLSKSIPPFAIVAGNPGRVVGWRKAPEKSS